MAEPHRIQRKRTRGWRMPPNTVYVGRPTFWSNPFNVRRFGAQGAVTLYRLLLEGRWLRIEERVGRRLSATGGIQMRLFRAELLRRLGELRGKRLCCWCRLDAPCHADVLLRRLAKLEKPDAK